MQFCAKCVKVLAREMPGRAKGSTGGFKEKQTQYSSRSVPWKKTIVPTTVVPTTPARIAGVACFIALKGQRACSIYRLAGSRKEKKRIP